MNSPNTETEGNAGTSPCKAQIPNITEQQSARAEKHKMLMALWQSSYISAQEQGSYCFCFYLSFKK